MIIQDAIVRIQTKGLITIPKTFRDQLGLKVNDLARVKSQKGRLIVEPVRTLPYPVRSYTDREVQDFLNEDEKEKTALKAKGLL